LVDLLAQFYTDSRSRVTSGFGHLLSGPNEKVVEPSEASGVGTCSRGKQFALTYRFPWSG
jgi:hypothetical protein